MKCVSSIECSFVGQFRRSNIMNGWPFYRLIKQIGPSIVIECHWGAQGRLWSGWSGIGGKSLPTLTHRYHNSHRNGSIGLGTVTEQMLPNGFVDDCFCLTFVLCQVTIVWFKLRWPGLWTRRGNWNCNHMVTNGSCFSLTQTWLTIHRIRSFSSFWPISPSQSGMTLDMIERDMKIG